MYDRCIPSKFGETNPSNPTIMKTTPRTLQIALAITNLLCFLVWPASDRDYSVVPGQNKTAACSLSALPMTATAQAACSTHDGKELTPPQFLRMHRCIRSVPEPDQNRK